MYIFILIDLSVAPSDEQRRVHYITLLKNTQKLAGFPIKYKNKT